MPDNDDLDRWLNQRATPLPPPDGTFELIKRRARRRKLRKLAVTLTTGAAVVTAGILIPRVTPLTINGPSTRAGTVGQGITPASSGSAQQHRTVAPQTTGPASTVPPPPVPPNFQPSSVTFVGQHTGWVIGQAGTPGHCATQYCTSIARTDNAGQTWQGVPAPETGAPDGSAGVGQIRFLNTSDGWAFGPELWATHNGGQTWTKIPTGGQRVVDLETAGTRAFGVFATCTGTGADFASGCTRFTLETTASNSDNWTPVAPATSGLTAGSAVPAQAPELVLAGGQGLLLAPDGTLLSGQVTGAWKRVSQVPCVPGARLLAAENPTTFALACPDNRQVYKSADGGATWQASTGYPATATGTSIAISPSGALVLATGSGILVYSGTSWQQATLGAAAPPGGFSYIGMTTASQGVALPADTSLHEIWMTFDGGNTWQPQVVR